MLVRHWRLSGTVLLAIVFSGRQGLSLAEEIVQFASRRVERPETGVVSVVDSQRAWVGLAYTGDGGASWIARQPPSTAGHRFDLGAPPFAANTFFVSAERGWLSGLDSIWTTEDGGSMWWRQVPGRLRGMAFAGNSGWLAAVDAKAVRNYTTADFGQTWRQCGSSWPVPEVGPLGWPFFLDAKNGWLTIASFTADKRELPYHGGVARTFDGGCTWKVLWRDSKDTEESERLGDVQFIDTDRGWLFASYGRLLTTGDGGVHWRAIGLPDSLRLESAYLESAARGWILGSGTRGSGFYYTLDGGEHWYPISTAEVRGNSGIAREIPRKWGAGFLRILQLRH